MRFSRILIDADAEEHVRRHGVTPEEVRQIAQSRPLVRRARRSKAPHPGARRTYALYGQTAAGRYVLAIVRALEHGEGKLVTARLMDDPERRLFARSRR